MSVVDNLDSNITGLRYAVELRPGVLPATPDWKPMEPNSYGSFGGEYSKKARNPINDSRQRSKGVTVDLTATAGIVQDITFQNSLDLLPGFLYADVRAKDLIAVAEATATGYEVAAGGAGYEAGDLLFAWGFDDAPNNGLKVVDAGGDATTVPVVSALTVAVGQTGNIIRVGRQFAAGDLAVTTPAGDYARLTSTAVDLTSLGLVPGEFIYIGGDGAAFAFANPDNSGFARVRTVAAGFIELDKTDMTYLADAGAGKTVQVFFGRVLRNEKGTAIRKQTIQFERTLGAPDDAAPLEVQAEYLTGCMPNEFSVSWSVGEILAATLGWKPRHHETVLAGDPLKTGNRPELLESDGFNASNNLKRINVAIVSRNSSFVQPLFAYVDKLDLKIANNVTENKALGSLGAFSSTIGTFEVSGSLGCFLTTLEATQAVKDNADASVDFHIAAANQGISWDFPLVSLGNAKSEVSQDKAIMLPISFDAARGRKIAADLDYTMSLVFWDYLPNAAMA